MIERIEAKMADNLRRMPNYTCTQTTDRSGRRQPSGPSELVTGVFSLVGLFSQLGRA